MSDRITATHLRALAQRLNALTGSPLEPWGRREDGSNRANIGNFHIGGAYGGWCLHRMSNESGGVTMPMGHEGHVPARELYDQMRAFIAGIEFARDSSAMRLARDVLNESAKQHRCRGDDGHARFCEEARTRLGDGK